MFASRGLFLIAAAVAFVVGVAATLYFTLTFKLQELKMRQKLSILFIVSIAVSLLLPICAGSAEVKVEVPFIKPTKQTLRFGHGLPPDSLYDKGANRFAELVKQYTRGEIEIKILCSAWQRANNC